jgi:hypothetical protein
LLKRANAVAATMRELLFINPNANRQELMFSLQAVETLMQMAQGSTREAQMRFEEIGDGWIRAGPVGLNSQARLDKWMACVV